MIKLNAASIGLFVSIEAVVIKVQQMRLLAM